MSEFHKLTPLQKELLTTYATQIREDELEDIKRLLGSYFAQKALKGAEKLWDEKGYSDETMEEWLTEKR